MLLVKPYLGCNRQCIYCHQADYRAENKTEMDYDIQAITDSMKENLNGNRLVCLHGGEPLMLPKTDIEKILQTGHRLTGRTSIQTNAFLLDDDHIKIFKRYSTSVGISYDGFGDLNSYRMTSKESDNIWDTMKKLRENNLNVGIITVVSKANAGSMEKLKDLCDFLLGAKELGIHGRLNPCYHLESQPDNLFEIYQSLAAFVIMNDIQWGPFTDIWNSLRHRGMVVCVFTNCDPFHTQAATVIKGDGSVINCLNISFQTNFERHDKPDNTRAEILLSKTQEQGGCKGCRWWSSCYGGCPAHGENNDWRNRTFFCNLYQGIFGIYHNMQNWMHLR